MAAPCTEHLFLTGEKGVGKSTLARHLLAGHTPCGFRTVRVTGVMDRPSVHLLPAVGGEATADNLLFYCGAYRFSVNYLCCHCLVLAFAVVVFGGIFG